MQESEPPLNILQPIQKNSLKWTSYRSKHKIIKLLQENTGKKILMTWDYTEFLDMTPKAQSTKA